MRGYSRESVMVETELHEEFKHQCRIHSNHGGFYEPTLSRFLNDMLTEHMDEWFSVYPPPATHDYLDPPEMMDYLNERSN